MLCRRCNDCNGAITFSKAQKLLRFRGALTLSLPSKVFLNAARVAHVSLPAQPTDRRKNYMYLFVHVFAMLQAHVIGTGGKTKC